MSLGETSSEPQPWARSQPFSRPKLSWSQVGAYLGVGLWGGAAAQEGKDREYDEQERHERHADCQREERPLRKPLGPRRRLLGERRHREDLVDRGGAEVRRGVDAA